jgi:O-antigen/teichoic acid export membrane protein
MDKVGYQQMPKTVAKSFLLNWRRPFASAYFRSASSYLGIRLIIITLAGLASQYLLTHYLAKGDYGLLVWVGTIIALLSPFFGLPGISTSITGAVAKGFEGNFSRGTWLEIAGGTVGGLVLFGFAGYYWFWTHEEIKALIFVVAGVLGPGLWMDTHQSYWNGKKNFKALFLWAVPVRLLQLIATATVLLYYSSNPLWVFGVQTVIQVAANLGAAFGIMKIGGVNKKTSKEYQSYGWFSTRLYWIGSFVSQLDKLIIGVFFGLESLAAFAVGELLYKYVYKTPSSFLSQIFLPRLAEMEIKQAARWIRNRQLYLISGIVLIAIVVGVAIPIVYPFLFSAKYNDSIYYAYLFLVGAALGSPTILCGTIIKSHAMKKETMLSWSILTITPLVLLPAFSWLWGLMGIIAVRGCTNLMISAYYLNVTRRLSANP